MTKVYFYHGAPDKIAAACGLLGKAYAQCKPVLVYAPEPQVAADLDRRLWTQSALSFIPHCRSDSPLASETPILVADRLDNVPNEERLMNLGQDVPPGFSRFQSLIEVVGQEEADRLAARERVRFYKERGYTIQFFDLAEA